MAFTFAQATKKQAKLRMALIGPSGSGKTYTALSIASALVPGGTIAVIDTERGSASLYAGDPFTFLHGELVDNYHPDRFVEAIKAAETAGVDVLIIDSISHEWNGPGGCLDLVEKFKSKYGGNKFAAWGDVTPIHDRLLDTINASRMHIIATMRAKTQYILIDDDKGRQKPQKVGMGPIQRDGAEYEFGIIGELDQDNTLVITKTRCSALNGGIFRKAGADVADILSAWLTDGAPTPEPSNDDQGDEEKPAQPRGNGKAPEVRFLTKQETRALYDYAKACTLSQPDLLVALDVSDIAAWKATDPLAAAKRAVDAWLEQEISRHDDDQDQSDAVTDDSETFQPALLDDQDADKGAAISSYDQNA